jgi:hypothetical protein
MPFRKPSRGRPEAGGRHAAVPKISWIVCGNAQWRSAWVCTVQQEVARLW